MTSPQPRSRRRRLVIGVLALALVLSLVGNALLLSFARHYYARELSVRLQPVAVARFTTTGNPSGVRVLFLGDSRVLEWPALPKDRFLTINAGVAGETTAQIRWRAEAALQAEKPAVVVVQAGINDLKAIGVLPDSASQIRSQCLANLQEIAALCHQHHARAILTTILPAGHVPLSRRLVWSPQIDASVIEINQSLMRQYATNEDVVVLDLDKILAGKRQAANDFSDYRDTLHLKPEAYQKFEPELVRLIEKTPSTNHQVPDKLQDPSPK